MKKSIIFIAVSLFMFTTAVSYGQLQKKSADPTVTIPGVSANKRSISKAELVSAGKIIISDSRYKITGFDLFVGDQRFSSTSDKLTTQMKNAINAVSSPVDLIICKITAVPKNQPNGAPVYPKEMRTKVSPN